MKNIIIEIYSILILIILFLDYNKQNKKKNSNNKKIFFLIHLSLFFVILINIFLKQTSNLIFQQFLLYSLFLLVLGLSIFVSLYLKNKFIFDIFQKGKRQLLIKCIYVGLIIGLFLLEFLKIGKINKEHIWLLFSLVPLLITIIIFWREKTKDRSIPYIPFNASLIIIFGQVIDYFNNDFKITIISYILALIMIYIYNNNKEIYSDYLTGVNNRKILKTEIYNDLLEIYDVIGVYLIDVDKFKTINDLYGHQVGDDILKETADILKKSVRNSDYIIRLGGDEFLIIVGLKKNNDLNCVYKRIVKNFEDHNQNSDIKIEVSIGYDLYSDNKTDFYELINKLDLKMYEQKRQKQ